MNIKTVLKQEDWDDFIIKSNKNTFLHSSNWANFNQKDHTIWQLGAYKNEGLVSACLVILVTAKRGRFLLIPHGPQSLEALNQQETLEIWTPYLQKLAKDNRCSFIRIQPIALNTYQNQKDFSKLGYRRAPIHVHTELSSVLNIAKEEKEILLNMRKTTRQMIKKGLKLIENDEVKINFPNKIDQEMHKIYEETYKRGGAIAYSQEYIDREWNIFSQNKNAKLITVSYQDRMISWGMILTCGKVAFYHQGGNYLLKNVPGSYLVQWHGIKFAMQKGCQTYDFWGVSPADQKDHPWSNISLFKRGFGGQDVELLHAQDYVLNWKYWPNWLLESYRAKKRGFA
jgi:lipid II:glycine glycyltransferase (peptidoglycan interpeptide bridge formation enzyme)